MRRPLCAAALVYTISVWILLQVMPWEPETYPDWNKKSVWAEGVVVSKEYKTNENKEVKLLIELEEPLLSGVSWDSEEKEEAGEMDADAADKITLQLPRRLIYRMGAWKARRSWMSCFPSAAGWLLTGNFVFFLERPMRGSSTAGSTTGLLGARHS